MTIGQAVNQKKNTGIYGGTFDPIHFGHISLALEMMEKKGLDEVWFIPANTNPFKSNALSTSNEHRLNMLKLAIEDIPNFFINEIELQREGPSYTIETLRALKSQEGTNHQNHYFLIIGEDAAEDFSKWRNPEEIISLATILVGGRISSTTFKDKNGVSNIQKALDNGRTPTRILEISSTEIRDRVSKGLYCGHLLPRKVLDYIILNDLYSKY